MSIGAALNSFEWEDRRINLLDTPGEPSFVADALGALRVCESAIFVINGVMGAEVSTVRLWERAEELDLARMVFVNMLDRERADFFRTLDSLKNAFGPHVVAVEIPIGSEQDMRGVVDLVDMKAYEYTDAGRENCREIPIPEELRAPIGNRVFGCDDCQIVCPWNRFARPTEQSDFRPRHGLDSGGLAELFLWSEEEFLARTEGSPLRRAGYERWLRNLAVGLGNALRATKDPAIAQALQARAEHPSALVREHVAWALAQG